MACSEEASYRWRVSPTTMTWKHGKGERNGERIAGQSKDMQLQNFEYGYKRKTWASAVSEGEGKVLSWQGTTWVENLFSEALSPIPQE
ncbi:unnamed protein product [Linum trigynum]|uniref:Uncharacterized protein n=1 Tax=Linum trigynum TaxID=586398 RepID=A0AAV2CDU8_9ROSI